MNGRKAKRERRFKLNRSTEQDKASYLREAEHALLTTTPKPLIERKRKLKDPIKPTWPRTKDQKLQSRPLIVVRPLYQLTHGLKPEERFAALLPHPSNPKWALDACAVRGL